MVRAWISAFRRCNEGGRGSAYDVLRPVVEILAVLHRNATEVERTLKSISKRGRHEGPETVIQFANDALIVSEYIAPEADKLLESESSATEKKGRWQQAQNLQSRQPFPEGEAQQKIDGISCPIIGEAHAE